MKEIIIKVSPIGDVDIEAVGFNGIGCKKATKAYEDEFGDTTSVAKPELHMSDDCDQHQHVGDGSDEESAASMSGTSLDGPSL